MRVLYISHNGMLEGLGQSQVLPYLRGLAGRGVQFDLFSYELPDAAPTQIEALRESLATHGIRWMPLRRRRDPRLRVKLMEAARGATRSLAAALGRRPDVVHGRSYLPTAVADAIASTVPKAKLLFDCRGMLGDEYVDAGYWSAEQKEYRLLKRYERRAFRRADGVVVLTDALRRWIETRGWLGPQTEIRTIPCCVDTQRFRFDAAARRRLRGELGLEGRTVLVYSGSLGGLYRVPDMARFAGVFKRRAAGPVAVLLLTPSPHEEFVDLLEREGVSRAEIVVRKAAPAEVPSFLSAGDAGMSFGKSCFARMGCSPTKLAEYLACGLPAVLNGDFGDQAELAAEIETCVDVGSFDDQALERAADRLLSMVRRAPDERAALGMRVVEARCDLEAVGVARYAALYEAIVRR